MDHTFLAELNRGVDETLDGGAYRLFFEANPQPMWIYDSQSLEFLAVNDAAVRRYGYSREEFCAMTLRNIRPRAEIPAVMYAAAGAPEEELLFRGIWRHETKTGEQLMVEISTTPLDWQGRRARLVVAVDVTERERITERLRRSEERFRITFEQAHVGIALIDRGGEVIEVNDHLGEMLGYSRQELLNSGISQISHPEDLAEQNRLLEMALRGEMDHYEMEKRYLHKDGHIVWASLGVVAVRNPEGALDYFILVAEDISAQKQVKHALQRSRDHLEKRVHERSFELAETDARLRESHAVLQAIIDGTTDAIYIRGLNNRYTLANRACAAYCTRSHRVEDVIGKSPLELFGEDIGRQVLEEDAEVLRTGETRTYERVLQLPDGPRTFLSTKGICRNDKGETIGVFGISRDVTERKRLERELLDVMDRERQRLGQDLHDDLCHDLAGIGLLANSLRERLDAKHLAGEMFDARQIDELIRTAAHKARNLARTLAPLGLTGSGFPRAVQELATRIQRFFKIDCIAECAGIELVDTGVATHLYRIMQEAATNAAKHSCGRRITLRVREESHAIVCSVEDDGVGLDAAQAARRGGIGIQSIRFRADLIGAKLEWLTRPEGGTAVVCTIGQQSSSSS